MASEIDTALNDVILVTGTTGHLGMAVCMALRDEAPNVRCIGVDVLPGANTTEVGSIQDRVFIERVVSQHGVTRVIHAATLHKPHVATHTKQQFIDTNVSGTLCLLEVAAKHGVKSFVYVSTTSVYSETIKRNTASVGSGDEAQPDKAPAEAAPLKHAVCVSETTPTCAKNIYGVTKLSAEALCSLMVRLEKLPVVILRVSRFFHEPDDDAETRQAYSDANSKVNEFLHRRVDVLDIVQACRLAGDKARMLAEARGWSTAPTYVISAPSPLALAPSDTWRDAPSVRDAVLGALPTDEDRRVVEDVYQAEGWRFPARLDRVYDSTTAMRELGWKPSLSFVDVVRLVKQRREEATGGDLGLLGSSIAVAVGRRGYHGVPYEGSNDRIGQPFPV